MRKFPTAPALALIASLLFPVLAFSQSAGNFSTVTVGTGYASDTPPTNGIIIQGALGVGTSAPGGLAQIGTNDTSITYGTKTAEFQNSIIVGDESAGGGLQFRNTAGTGTVWGMGIDSSNNLYVGYAQNDLYLRTNGVKQVTIDSSGNVGFGTSSPSYPLHVVGPGSSVTDLYITDQSSAATTFGSGSAGGGGSAYLNLTTGASSGSTAGSYVALHGKLESWVTVAASSNTSGQRVMRFGNGSNGCTNCFAIQSLNDAETSINATPFQLANNAPSNSLTIGSSGAIGIGTLTPHSLVQAYNGEVQVGSSGVSCAAANNGAIRYASGTLYYCAGTTWTAVSGGGTVNSSYAMTSFTTSGTFTTPSTSSSSTIYRFTIVGAGGGSGGSQSGAAASGGGGAGETCIGTFTGVAASTGISITINSGGAAGTNAPTAGGNGGATTIGSPVSVTVNGGGGSNPGSAGGVVFPGATGGSGGCSGATDISGGAGQYGFFVAGTSPFALGGNGAASFFGGGGLTTFNGPGSSGAAPGSGAGGSSGAGGAIGGAMGAPGLVIIEQMTP